MRALAALDATCHWGAGEVAVGVLDRSGVLAVRGPAAERREYASVTKLFSALALLLACEERVVALDDPAGPRGSTLAHLLAHASGCSPEDPARVLAAPGRRRIYSNAGFELAADHLESASGIAFAEYLSDGVLAALGAGTVDLGTSAARGASGTLEDLLRLGAELLEPRVLAPETLSLAREVHFPGISGVVPGFGRQDPCDWGLGFELAGHKSPHWTGTRRSPESFGHFGQSGSFLLVDPVAGVTVALLAGVPFGPWAARAWPELVDAIFAELLGPGPGSEPGEEPGGEPAGGARR